jgi:hypothetical protein
MKKLVVVIAITSTILSSAWAGLSIKPISNPVYTDVPETSLHVRPIFIHHALPDMLNTELGDIPAGGDVQIIALQFEIPISETLSIIAVKDGYIDIDADNTLSDQSGFADLAAGLKYIICTTDDSAASIRTVVEFPIGDDEVLQGNGDGNINVGVSYMKQTSRGQCLASIGYIHALDSAESSLFYDSWQLSYNLTDRVIPVLELNHFRVVDEGNGPKQFTAQVDGGVPAVARWEGGDLINLGAAHADQEADFVTLAIGARVVASDKIIVGAAYEFPLTDDKNGLMDSRITLDAILTF